VRELAGQRFAGYSLDMDVSPARGVSRNVRVMVDAREPDGRPKSLLRPKVRVEAGGPPRDLVARQVGPGRYEASLTVDAGAIISASLVDDTVPATAGLSRRFVPDAAAEYRFRAPDNALLTSLASSTGGKVGPDAEALRRSGTDSRAARRAMWPGLVLFSLVGWAVDLLLRRVRLFER